jgi:hypothetical protein
MNVLTHEFRFLVIDERIAIRWKSEPSACRMWAEISTVGIGFDGTEVRVKIIELSEAYGFGRVRQNGRRGGKSGCANVVAEEVGCGEFGGGVEAFEN